VSFAPIWVIFQNPVTNIEIMSMLALVPIENWTWLMGVAHERNEPFNTQCQINCDPIWVRPVTQPNFFCFQKYVHSYLSTQCTYLYHTQEVQSHFCNKTLSGCCYERGRTLEVEVMEFCEVFLLQNMCDLLNHLG